MNYKLLLQYDGTKLNGWQKQGNTDNTIQGKLEAILEKMYGEYIEIHGSGRTDAGVHALGQAANFHAPATFSVAEIHSTLNEYLSKDIRVLSVETVSERFHARLTAKGKNYEYRIDNGKIANVFQRKYTMREEIPLDLDAMREAAAYLIGTHDFKTFCANKKMKKSTVRTIYSIVIEEKDGIVVIRYTGNGFLYNMVRILTGTLIEVGRGKRTADEIPGMIEAQARGAAGFTAPAQGLFLVEVMYT
ncbi:MAG: tRNA pseudouridine(38-40) synthase TruA [Lachnospiraceae bacterium]|nr:tRNA pseudouridine(38-40) synthase TruA [Lachnospiraceae bacterium]